MSTVKVQKDAVIFVQLTLVSDSDSLAAERLVVSGELLLRLRRISRPENDPCRRITHSVRVQSLHKHLKHKGIYRLTL